MIKNIIGILSIVFILLVSGCVAQTEDKPAPEIKGDPIDLQLTINLCETDPSNADLWRSMDINLFNKPTALQGAFVVGTVPSCQDVTVFAVEEITFGEITFYKVNYDVFSGWQTKRLLTGVE